MRVRSRALGVLMLVAALAGCSDGASSSTTRAPASKTSASKTSAPVVDTGSASSTLPIWMPIADWAQRPWAKASVGAVWLVRHAGQEAWLIDAPRMMARDTLVRSDGAVICNPAGFGASGDGRCPTVVDAGTTPHLAWVHPGNPSPTFGPPPPEPVETPVVAEKPRPPRAPLPAWLETQVAVWERQDHGDAAGLSVTRLQHKGATAYLIYAGCCDAYNTLYDAEGRELCSPSGGITGEGDGKCPTPEDPGTKPVLVWEHPGSSRD